MVYEATHMAATLTSPWSDWFTAAKQPAVDQAIADLYRRLDADIAARGPTCWQSGKCCHFDVYGHRLYVTGLEIARFLQQPSHQADAHAPQTGTCLTLPIVQQTTSTTSLPAACVYQVDRQCTVHANRPMGCRIFFCQQGTQAWQQDLYEQYLQQLRRLHDTWATPYQYMEWRTGLREAAQYLAGV